MDRSIDLTPLVCTKCNTPIPAKPDEAVWVCEQCGQGLALDEEKGLLPVVAYYAAGIPPNASGKPYWVAEGRVTLQRETYDMGSKGVKEAEQFWSQPRRFLIPAFSCTLEALLTQGTGLLLQPPTLQPGTPARYEPATLPYEAVFSIAEFIVVAIEAGRKDKMKKINFTLNLTPPVLWILP